MSDPVMGDEIGTGSEYSSMEKVHQSGVDNGHGHGYSSSSSSTDDEHTHQDKFHLFGRQKPIHKAFGGGKPADVVLWRNKQMSGALLAGATVIWLLFEWIGYHLITFLCHSIILSLATLFLWSNLSYSINRSALNFPEIALPEDLCRSIALLLRDRCNQVFGIFRQVASGNDLKNFFCAILGLWVVSIVGSWFDFLTLVYIIFVMLLTMPLLYEKHEDRVDSYAQKATAKLKRQYSTLDEKVLQKLPKVPFITDNKQH
ncbi:Reticulon-like protein B5 [Abeliophyllum distichum]|uniref:Reticulon-like protein n=1 Tax=Abeliophyllum distichum TaxID=126358 RepID=A0ABD1Q6S5_9LAMI